tara:strand:+ start:3242 stop:3925 length:684 start_codon:yes stop_codon:yes gene_type:complete
MKKLFFVVFSILILFTNTLSAHVNHYSQIKYLKYNIYFNNVIIGYHTFDFTKKDQILEVKGEGRFKLTKLGIDVMNYKTHSRAIYKNNQLIEFKSETIQNDKKKYTNIKATDNILKIQGSSFNGQTDKDSIISSWWNHEIVTKNKQISSVSGRVMDQKVKFLGKKKIIIKNKNYNAINFHIISDDEKKIDDKKLNIKIWYNSDNLIWLKASYEKFGTWEYRLEEVKY